MKKAITLLLAVIALFGCNSCTHLDGDIGDWFGSWLLEEILIDGKPDEAYNPNHSEENLVMVSFQGKVFNMAYLDSSEIYGSWSYAGEILTLVASYNAGTNDSVNFNPYPKVLHFPEGEEQLEITVTYIKSKTMQWQYIDQNGNLLTYNFKKYP